MGLLVLGLVFAVVCFLELVVGGVSCWLWMFMLIAVGLFAIVIDWFRCCGFCRWSFECWFTLGGWFWISCDLCWLVVSYWPFCCGVWVLLIFVLCGCGVGFVL